MGKKGKREILALDKWVDEIRTIRSKVHKLQKQTIQPPDAVLHKHV